MPVGARAVLQIGEHLLVGRHNHPPRSAFDDHVGDCHAAFNAQPSDRRPGELHRIADRSCGADVANDRHDDVLRRNAGMQSALDANAHRFQLLVDNGLGRQIVLDIRRADAEAERTERAVGRRVAVAGGDHHARQDETLLRGDDVLDALPSVEDIEQLDAEIGAVRFEHPNLVGRLGILNMPCARCRGRVDVIDDGERGTGPPTFTSGLAQAVEGLRAGVLIEDRAVDIEKNFARSVQIADGVRVAKLLVERARRHSMRAGPRLASLCRYIHAAESMKVTIVDAILLSE